MTDSMASNSDVNSGLRDNGLIFSFTLINMPETKIFFDDTDDQDAIGTQVTHS
jgi:hypothetical protein